MFCQHLDVSEREGLSKNRRAKFLCRAGGKIFVYLSFPRKDLEVSVRSGEKKEGAGSKTEVSGDMKKAVCLSPPPSACQPQTSSEVTSYARGSGFFEWILRCTMERAEFHL